MTCKVFKTWKVLVFYRNNMLKIPGTKITINDLVMKLKD